VTASEFAFLAIGLVLGVAAGAALVEVARSRPAARPEVRVTVAPHAREHPCGGTPGRRSDGSGPRRSSGSALGRSRRR
jgi:hypothetical protein